MAQTIKLKDADRTLRNLIASFSGKSEECVIQNEDNQAVAVVLPARQYASYQAYLKQREEDFAVLDEIAETMKQYDPEEIQAGIDQAVNEVNAQYRATRQAT